MPTPASRKQARSLLSRLWGRLTIARGGREAGRGGATTRPMRVSLTMIVRDEEANLPACLDSAARLFDEVIVVDTGSVDRTREIACSFGAIVHDFPWCDDFAAARNASLERATGDYIFWLDADDRIDAKNYRCLRTLFAGLQRRDTAYVMAVLSSSVDGTGAGFVVDQVRLFPNDTAVRWSGRVHEQILPALERQGIATCWTGVTIEHTGYSDAALRRQKTERKSKLLMAELIERPDDPFLLWNLGRVALDRKDTSTAIRYLEAGYCAAGSDAPIRRNILISAALAHQLAGDLETALSTCLAGQMLYPNDGDLLFREAVVRKLMGDFGGAEACWRRVLQLKRPERFQCAVAGLYGHLPRRNLALLAEERGERIEASKLWAEVLRECPGDPQATIARIRIAREMFSEWGARLVNLFTSRSTSSMPKYQSVPRVQAQAIQESGPRRGDEPQVQHRN